MCVYVCVYTHTYIHTYKYTYMRTYTHKYTYTYIYIKYLPGEKVEAFLGDLEGGYRGEVLALCVGFVSG